MSRPLLSFMAIFALSAVFTLYSSVSKQALAQSVPVNGAGIELSTSINNPEPGQMITITARSYSADISASNITWTADGKMVKKGLGENVLEIAAPPLGKTLSIKVTAITSNGVNLNRSLNIKSGSVDLIVENNGYVPPFFKGKLPVSYQNTVKIIAIPHLADSSGKEYDPQTLVYKWKKGSQVIENQSGYGAQSITLVGELVPRNYTVTVIVSTRDGSAQTSGAATVSFGSPSVAFYVDDPLYGPLFHKTINDIVRIGTERETGVLAVPFGFNKPEKGLGNLVLAWLINGYEYPDLASNQSVILRTPDNTQGSSDISISVRNKKDILQGSSAGFSAVFISNQASNADIVNF